MKKNQNYTRRLGAIALGILFSTQTSCTNHSQLEFGGDRKISHTDELFSAITKNHNVAATYLFNHTNLDQYIKLIQNIKDSDSLSEKDKSAALSKIRTKVEGSKLDPAEKTLALEKITKKDSASEIPVEGDENDLESNNTRRHSYILRKHLGNVSGIIASNRLSNEQKYKQLKKLLQEQKTSPKKLVEVMIEEVEIGDEYEARGIYKLLKRLKEKNLIKPAVIRGQLFKILSININSGHRNLYRLLRGLDRDGVVTYLDMIEDTLEHLEEASKLYMLQKLQSKIKTLLVPEKYRSASYTYRLLKALHAGEGISLQGVLEHITVNRKISLKDKKIMLQNIFEKSNYYRDSIAKLPESVIPTLQWIIDNRLEAQEQEAFLKHVPEALKQQLKLAVLPAPISKSLFKKASKKISRAKSLILRNKSTKQRAPEGSAKADTM